MPIIEISLKQGCARQPKRAGPLGSAVAPIRRPPTELRSPEFGGGMQFKPVEFA